jgi:hypothetical protein
VHVTPRLVASITHIQLSLFETSNASRATPWSVRVGHPPCLQWQHMTLRHGNSMTYHQQACLVRLLFLLTYADPYFIMFNTDPLAVYYLILGPIGSNYVSSS